MLRSGDRSSQSSARLAVVRWEGNLVIGGCLTGLKVWGVVRLGVLGVGVGVLVGVVVGHDVCWHGWEPWGVL